MNVMTDTVEKENVSSHADDAIDVVVNMQQEALETIESANVTMIDGLTRVQREIAGFVSERISHDLETQRKMMRCKTLAEVPGIQAQFFKTAMEQYAAETSRLLKIGGELIGKSRRRGA